MQCESGDSGSFPKHADADADADADAEIDWLAMASSKGSHIHPLAPRSTRSCAD